MEEFKQGVRRDAAGAQGGRGAIGAGGAALTDFMDFSKKGRMADVDLEIIERVDAWNGMVDEVVYTDAYDHKDRAEVARVIEDLRAQALADNPKIAGAVWWIVFGTVLVGAAALNLSSEFLGWLLFAGVIWGAQAWICRLAKRGRGGVPPHLVAYLMANAKAAARALEAGDAEGVAMHARMEQDTLREIYLYMRGAKK